MPPLSGGTSWGSRLLRAGRELYRASDPRVPTDRRGSRVILSRVPERANVGTVEGDADVVAAAAGCVCLGPRAREEQRLGVRGALRLNRRLARVVGRRVVP